MVAGRPIKRKSTGFENDIHMLNKLRTALKIDRDLDKNSVAKAVQALDTLVEQLIGLHNDMEKQ